MNKASFSSLVPLPDLIIAPGEYILRSGEHVVINVVSTNHDFGCTGAYKNGVREGWHKSGRIFCNRETCNDIVSASSTNQ